MTQTIISTGKLNFDIIKKLRNTSKQFVDFILCLSELQDVRGYCSGIYYKDIAGRADICHQSFYNYMALAEKLGIIKIYWDAMSTRDRYWRFSFVDNIYYLNKKKHKNKRYINTHMDIFHTKEFKTLKLNEKLLIINILSLGEIRDPKHKHTKKLAIGTLMNYADTTNFDMFSSYLETLTRFFSITFDEMDDSFVCLKLLPQYCVKPVFSTGYVLANHLLSYYKKKYKLRNRLFPDSEFLSITQLICLYMQNHFYLITEVILKYIKNISYLGPLRCKEIETTMMSRLADLKKKISDPH